MGTLLSVNVGMPKDVPWQGKTVVTGVFKDPVTGPRRVRKLNVDGDGQGDLAGHGGEQRAVFVYQLDSYRYWERELGRDDFVYGQFGENFTVDGLHDDEVCIGDRYRIGTALFEVTQPRVTCYRVGIRMNDPRIPALLVSHHRPGFYFRVLEEGDVEAGDEIVKVAAGPEQMTVAEIDALLYLPGPSAPAAAARAAHPRPQPRLARLVPRAARREPGGGNAGLGDSGPAARMARLPPVDRHRDRARERLGDLDPARGPRRCSRCRRRAPASTSPCASSPATRSARCSATTPSPDRPAPDYYRITVKREHDGAASGYLHSRLAVGDQLDDRSTARHLHPRPDASARSADQRRHRRHSGTRHAPRTRDRSTPTGRSGGSTAPATAASTPFAAEARALLASLPNAHVHISYSRPGPDDLQGRDFDDAGHLTASLLAELEPPRDAEAYLCGPAPFMDEVSAGLAAIGARRCPTSTPSRSAPHRV